jgi:PilZ domain-containing protein
MSPEITDHKPRPDRRLTPRRRVLKGGVVAFNDHYSSLPCTVRDISDTGARLRIDGSMNAPDKFDLIIEIDGLEVPCEVVSRKAGEIAVRFVAPPRVMAPRRVQVVKALVPTKPPTLRRQPKPVTNS